MLTFLNLNQVRHSFVQACTPSDTGPKDPAASALLEALAHGPLTHWPPPPDAQWYMSRPRPFDQNILNEVVRPTSPLLFRY
jgi:hypothetical protein